MKFNDIKDLDHFVTAFADNTSVDHGILTSYLDHYVTWYNDDGKCLLNLIEQILPWFHLPALKYTVTCKDSTDGIIMLCKSNPIDTFHSKYTCRLILAYSSALSVGGWQSAFLNFKFYDANDKPVPRNISDMCFVLPAIGGYTIRPLFPISPTHCHNSGYTFVDRHLDTFRNNMKFTDADGDIYVSQYVSKAFQYLANRDQIKGILDHA